jgi:hypothetical protein
MARKQISANFKNVKVKVSIPTIDGQPTDGSIVTVKGNGPTDVFVHYDDAGTFRGAAVWNGKTWVNVNL